MPPLEPRAHAQDFRISAPALESLRAPDGVEERLALGHGEEEVVRDLVPGLAARVRDVLLAEEKPIHNYRGGQHEASGNKRRHDEARELDVAAVGGLNRAVEQRGREQLEVDDQSECAYFLVRAEGELDPVVHPVCVVKGPDQSMLHRDVAELPTQKALIGLDFRIGAIGRLAPVVLGEARVATFRELPAQAIDDEESDNPHCIQPACQRPAQRRARSAGEHGAGILCTHIVCVQHPVARARGGRGGEVGQVESTAEESAFRCGDCLDARGAQRRPRLLVPVGTLRADTRAATSAVEAECAADERQREDRHLAARRRRHVWQQSAVPAEAQGEHRGGHRCRRGWRAGGEHVWVVAPQ
mmetsp:Transcript_40357/g.95078  ORF Transcript_40357/g.95078 Transcript_40357/m.95078 type:complete len:357 (-) Transcript_40357:719-1789(-)